MSRIFIAVSFAALLAGCASDPANDARIEATQADRDAKQVVTGSNIPKKGGGASGVVIVAPGQNTNEALQGTGKASGN